MNIKILSLTNANKEDNFGFEWFSELRIKFDLKLKNLEEKSKALERTVADKDTLIEELQTELSTK